MTFVIYAEQPKFPATDQNPNCVRYQVGARWVDTDNPSPPTQADIDAILNPDLVAVDTASLNAALLAPGSVDRAELKTLFNHENRIRALEGKAAITQAQFVAALQAAIR